MRNLFLIFIISIIAGCSEKEPKVFTKPTLVDDSTLKKVIPKFFQKNNMSYQEPLLIGKYPFKDTTIFISKDTIRKYKYYRQEDYFQEDQTKYMNPNTDTISSIGLDIIVDHKQNISLKLYDSIAYYYFPIYIINKSNQIKAFNGKDSHSFGLQEAIDSSFYKNPVGVYPPWFAISMGHLPFCGNGYWTLKLNPKEYVLILMPKFKGEIKTMLRARLAINNSIFVSKPYPGSINQSQFISKDSILFKSKYSEEVIWYSKYLYGAVPKEFY